MSKIRKSAKGEDCTAELPGICNHDPEKVVLAHIRKLEYGAGGNLKPNDLFSLYACSDCHDVIDGRRKTDLDKEFIWLKTLEGHMTTLKKLIDKGLV